MGANLPNIADENTPENSPAPSVPASEASCENLPATLPQQSAFEIPSAQTAYVTNCQCPCTKMGEVQGVNDCHVQSLFLHLSRYLMVA